jgi:hypothetical protein
MLGPALGQHIFLFRGEDRKLLDLRKIAIEPRFAAGRGDRRNFVTASHDLSFSLSP